MGPIIGLIFLCLNMIIISYKNYCESTNIIAYFSILKKKYSIT